MRATRAGGFIIAVSVLAGAFIGVGQGQVSAGVLIGLLTGAGLATLLWLIDRR
jgi:hypothetical protein